MNIFLKKLKGLAQILLVVTFSMWLSVLFAATPSPGHSWKEVGDGWWAATGTTAYRTFTFPDASSTILTDNALVTVAQGGTGSGATSTALNILNGLSAKGDIFVRGVSIIGRLGVGTNGQVLTASSSQSIGLSWSPIVLTPAGSNTYVQFNDGGIIGSISDFIFGTATQTLALNGQINLGTQSDPSPPASGTLSVYAKSISGRSMLKSIGPRGVDYAYQPSFFQNAIFMISTGAGTAYSILGTTASSTGTVSHVVSQPLGYMANQVTGTIAGNTAGTGTFAPMFYRGTQVGSNGFFFQSRMAFPTATSTGIRIFVGFTSGLLTSSVSADDPAGSGIGWQYSTVRGDTGWKFMTDDGASQTLSATMLPMAVNEVFDFFIYCPPFPNNGTVYYRVDNLTQGTTAEGSTSATLPAGGVGMAAGFQINNISAAAKNVRVSRLYVETDR